MNRFRQATVRSVRPVPAENDRRVGNHRTVGATDNCVVVNDQVQHAVIVTGVFVMGMLIPVRSVFMDRCGTTINRSVHSNRTSSNSIPSPGLALPCPMTPNAGPRRRCRACLHQTNRISSSILPADDAITPVYIKPRSSRVSSDIMLRSQGGSNVRMTLTEVIPSTLATFSLTSSSN